MKGRIIRQIVSVWLMAVLVVPFGVQFVHSCQVGECSTHGDCYGHDGAEHDNNTCAICQFTLAPFNEADNACVISVPTSLFVNRKTVYAEKINDNFFTSFYLRAPPASFS